MNSYQGIQKKLKTESNNVDFSPRIKQEELNIERINSNIDDNKYYNEMTRSIFDIVKIKDVYNQAKILNIQMITSINNNVDENSELKNKIKTNIEITPLGYTNSKRKKDGITFFGYDKKKENDLDIYIEPLDGDNVDEKFFGKHFQIKFEPGDLNYYLKDLGHGFGTFIRINDWVEIKNNFLLNIGENYLIFTTSFEKENTKENNLNGTEENNSSLNIKLFSVSSGQKSYFFKSSNAPITIGRKIENDICIEDTLLSRIHCTINYKDNKWLLIDGSINKSEEEENKKSTNGSWIYPFEDTLIYDKMCFKASHYLFECNLENISNKKDDSIKKNDLSVL